MSRTITVEIEDEACRLTLGPNIPDCPALGPEARAAVQLANRIGTPAGRTWREVTCTRESGEDLFAFFRACATGLRLVGELTAAAACTDACAAIRKALESASVR